MLVHIAVWRLSELLYPLLTYLMSVILRYGRLFATVVLHGEQLEHNRTVGLKHTLAASSRLTHASLLLCCCCCCETDDRQTDRQQTDALRFTPGRDGVCVSLLLLVDVNVRRHSAT